MNELPNILEKSGVRCSAPAWSYFTCRLFITWVGYAGQAVGMGALSSPLSPPVSSLELGNWWQEQVSQRKQDQGHYKYIKKYSSGAVSHVPGTTPGSRKMTMTDHVLPSWASISWEGQPTTKHWIKSSLWNGSLPLLSVSASPLTHSQWRSQPNCPFYSQLVGMGHTWLIAPDSGVGFHTRSARGT